MKSKYNRLSRLNQIVLALATVGALMSSAYATTTYTWTGTTTPQNWSGSSNWDTNGIPASDVTNTLVAINPGAITLTSMVDSAWNSTGSGSINSLTFSSGTLTLTNGAAGTNLTLGSGGFTNSSGNTATINFNNIAGGKITTSGSQIWSTNSKSFSFSGNLAATSSSDVITVDTGTSAGSGPDGNIPGQRVLFNGAYSTAHTGSLVFKGTAGTAGNSLVFNSQRSGAWDRFANITLNNNSTSQNMFMGCDGVGNNNTFPANVTFQNFVASTNNRAIIAGTSGNFGNPMGTAAVTPVHLGLNFNYTGNWSGSLLAKTINDPRYPAITFSNNGAAMTLSGDNSGLTIDVNDVLHNKTTFSTTGFLVANSANALGLNNTLGVNISGGSNANVPTGRTGLLATPAASPVRSDISVSASQFSSGGIPAQPGFGSIGLRPDAANTDTVTFSGNIYSNSYFAQNAIRLVTGLTNDASHGGSIILNGAIQDFAYNYNYSNFTSNYVSSVQFLGTGTFALNGANTYAGNTSIRSGTVLVGSNAPAGFTLGTSTTLPKIPDDWATGPWTGYTTPIGTTQIYLSSVTGLSVGQPFGSAAMGFQPGTVITQVNLTPNPNVVISKPTVAAITNNGGVPVAAGGAFGLTNTAISLGDTVPTLLTVKAASTCFNANPPGTSSWASGVYTFTSGGNTLDGASLSIGDKVLLWGAYSATQTNGVYQVTDATHWTRLSGWDTTAAMLANVGSRIHVTSGTINAGMDYELAPVNISSGTNWTINNPVNSTSAATSGPIVFIPDVPNPNVAILTNGAYTIARPINVTNNQSTGTSSLGGNTSDSSTFSGLVTLSKDLTVTAATSGTVTFSGDITGPNNVSKVGAGTVKFTTAKSYTGTTSVTAGTLEVDNTVASSGVTVGSGGSLQGTGTVTNTLSVTGTGIVTPGSSGTGTLTVGSGSAISGHLAVNVDDLTNTELLSSGTINLTGATLDLTVGGGGFTQPYYVIAQGSSITGTPSVTTGYTLTNTGTQLRLSLTPTTHSISGTVTRSGSALSGVTVSDGTRTATTDGSGAYTITSVPDSATYTVTPSLTGYTFSPANQSVTLSGSDVTGINFAVANAFGNWATIHGLSGADAAPTANPSHDGLSNLVKYALDLNPAVSAQPAGTLSGSTLSFTKGAMAKADSNLVYSIEESTDLTTWTAPTGSSPSGSVSNLTNTITYTFPSGQTKVFARLKVVQTP